MLNIEDTIVLVIDFQDRLISATNAETEEEKAVKMINAANTLSIPVIVSEQYPKGLGHTSENLRINMPSESIVFEKTAFSLIREENVLEKIAKLNKKQIIIMGIETHICVLQTALELIEKGYEVYLIKDACKSRANEEHLTGINYMQNEGVKILSLEIALFQLLKTSKNEHFKEIQALIK